MAQTPGYFTGKTAGAGSDLHNHGSRIKSRNYKWSFRSARKRGARYCERPVRLYDYA